MSKMVHSDFKVRKDKMGRIETISFGDRIDRSSSCPELDICSYASKGKELSDREKSNKGLCYWNYEECSHYAKN